MSNKKSVNKLCQRCERSCKQESTTILITCPHYIYKSQQLELKFDKPERIVKK